MWAVEQLKYLQLPDEIPGIDIDSEATRTTNTLCHQLIDGNFMLSASSLYRKSLHYIDVHFCHWRLIMGCISIEILLFIYNNYG